MYVSYAKDICQKLMELKVWDTPKRCMLEAIELVKQAKKAFTE